MVRSLLYTTTLAACLACTPVQAQSWTQNNPYAPWLWQASSSDKTASQGEGSHALIAAPHDAYDHDDDGIESMPAPDDSIKAPPVALLTPQHTQRILQQLEAQEQKRKASLLEQAYSLRIVDELTQFGYDMFGTEDDLKPDIAPDASAARAGLPGGMAQDDLVLGSGDRLMITLRGQSNQQNAYAIDNQGFLSLPDMTPIPAAGLTLGQVRTIIEAEVAMRHNQQVFVSLDAVRQIDVLVIGHVKKPGRRTLSVFHTVLDALMESGGIEKTGSLRQIKLVRDGRSTYIDLYALQMHGGTNIDMQLRDGDRLIVPPIGPTMAIAGNIKRPGIYEILPAVRGMHAKGDNSQKISLEEALDLAGGYISPGQNRLIRLSLTADGREQVHQLGDDPYLPALGDGSILMVSSTREARSGTVELTGHTRQPGIHDLAHNATLSALIPSESLFGPDIYPLIGVIERQDSQSISRTLIDFSPLLVAKGQYDAPLEDGDIVHLFSREQILALNAASSSDIVEMGSAEDDERIDGDIVNFLKGRAVYVRGAVRHPGPWPVTDGSTLKSLISSAGGLTVDANTDNIEITPLSSPGQIGPRPRFAVNFSHTDPSEISVGPGDTVRVNQKFNRITDNSVLISGEVNHPGRYDLSPGDTIYDLLQRAGGLNDQAYPEGAIFSRENERRAEEARFRAAAQDLERALAASMDKDTPPDATQIAMARDLAAQLRSVEAVGRITVEADPGILAIEPELNILLEKGDRIYIPKRPLTVRVNGEVLSPANLQFRKNKNPRDYIMEAGGFTYHADDDRAFVLYPDGSAQPLQVSNWNHKAAFIPPGSTIVVPRDPKPFDFIQSAKDISQILSNLAVTGIFLDDLSDDD
ncbi:MAG: SLBB domain-containing protein [Micavibrio aeruginosavorus]|uniref:SLBB domain-containing protein n=1 Tax=Micavibrio aeruginosavorus TaxID=349221 RepID=A0A7T5UHU3_9BACT|nr:MAG: SLBB domain-containing protein [Micavibrio aeruginosavorus]